VKELTEPARVSSPPPCAQLPEQTGRGSPNRIMLARPVSGVVGETRRTTHVFVSVTGPATSLTALCGLQFELASVEFLDGLTGMPCVKCMVIAVSQQQPLTPQARE